MLLKLSRRLGILGLVGLTIGLFLIFYHMPVQAQTVQAQTVQAQISVDSRITRLENDVAGLRFQLDQLIANRSLSGSRPAPLPPTIGSSPQRTVRDPQFDRLATLVIELRERITAVEEQVKQLRRR